MIDVTPNQDGGTFKQVQREGVGTATPQPGDTLYTHYHGTLTDGTLFDASRPRGNMFLFKIGTSKSHMKRLCSEGQLQCTFMKLCFYRILN